MFIDETNDSHTKKYEVLSKLDQGLSSMFFYKKWIYSWKSCIKQIKNSSANLLSDREIKDEIEILKNLDHPDIVLIIESFNTKNSFILITEYYEGGELFDQGKIY